MGKLIRMDLYRMLKSRSFLICLGLSFLMALGSAPIGKLMFNLALTLSAELTQTAPPEMSLFDVFSAIPSP